MGDRVAVSGLWRGQQVVGSLLSPAQSELDLVSGDVSRGQQGPRIGGVTVRGLGLTRPEPRSFATAIGQYDPAKGRLSVRSVEPNRFKGAAGRLQRLSVEGYLDRTNEAPGYRISGLGHSFKRNLRFERYKDQRVLFDGPYESSFAVEKARVLPENFEARRRLLRNFGQR